MTDDRTLGVFRLSAEQMEQKLDLLAEKLRSLAGGAKISLELQTAEAETRLNVLQAGVSQGTAAAHKSYEDAIGALKTLKSLSQLTYEQELNYLESIRASIGAYSLSAREALDLEQRLLAVQAEIAARDAQSLDSLLGGIMTALENQYESMRGAELKMLSDSRDAWKAWRQSSTDAIQAQIDALDDLAEAEDRAAEEAAYLRRMEKLSQAIAYEQDSFNKSQLTAQLSDAQAAYEAWLSQNARDDRKAALQEQRNAVNAKTEAELNALDEQVDAVNAAYAAQLEAAAIRAEAEKRLMSGTQADILSLITAFAPEYNAAGQTLGEQMLAGFAEKAGSIADWMENLNAMILGVQQSLNTALQSAADSFYLDHAAATSAGVTITQQNTFNTPVETPSETAYRIKQANEQLAEQLIGN